MQSNERFSCPTSVLAMVFTVRHLCQRFQCPTCVSAFLVPQMCVSQMFLASHMWIKLCCDNTVREVKF